MDLLKEGSLPNASMRSLASADKTAKQALICSYLCACM